MKVNLSMIPKKFDRGSYLNIKTGEVIKLEDVDAVLLYETEQVFIDYYNKLREEYLLVEENKIMHRFVLEKLKEYFSPLLDTDYLKQRDALETFSTRVSNSPLGSDYIIMLLKDHPKDYKEVAEQIINTVSSFDSETTLETIEDSALDDDLAEQIASTLSIPKAKELFKENYNNRIIRSVYLILTNTDEYDEFLNNEIEKVTPEIEQRLTKMCDEYKHEKYEEYLDSVSSSIINLYDYVLGNKLVRWLDDGKTISLITTSLLMDDVFRVYSKSQGKSINVSDIKEIHREGNSFTVVCNV